MQEVEQRRERLPRARVRVLRIFPAFTITHKQRNTQTTEVAINDAPTNAAASHCRGVIHALHNSNPDYVR
jgi:hypothetical protein